jgi:hypothetical protein
MRRTIILALLAVPAWVVAAEPTVDFGRDIQPILSDRCYKCHGPDEAKREGELRFDVEQSARAERDGKRAVVAGEVVNSELIKRIESKNPELRMPPPDSKLSLSPREIELFKTWIAQGAKWGGHWSFTPPVRPPLPDVGRSTAPSYAEWPRNAIDGFILQRLRQENLTPSSQASATQLIRRVTLDLTGLPPTPEEIAGFIADRSPDAYERLVDRLLASPRYGEQMALPWLDAARYADTSGYQNDGPRHMWRWRDWVIESLNANMPFDQFTVEQLAGDLLPNPTLEQRIATGFNRNHRGNAEGGIIPAEYAVEYVVDRVDTTATVWMGLTLGCTRCHDHKYDPFTQQEFYQLFAYFNNIPEHGRAIKEGNSPPFIEAPTRAQQDELRQAKDALSVAKDRLRHADREIAAAQAKWEATVDRRSIADWEPDDGVVVSLSLEREQAAGATSCDGAVGKALRFDGQGFVDAGDVANFGYFDKFTLAAWIHQNKQGGGTILSRMTDEAEGDGYSVVLRNGTLQVLLVKRWLDDSIRVETAQAVIQPDHWQHVAVTYDGTRLAKGIAVYVDGQKAPLTVQLDAINQTFATPKVPLRIGAGNGPDARFRGAIDEVRVFNRVISSAEAALLARPESVSALLAIEPAKRTNQQQEKLRTCFLRRHASEPLGQLVTDIDIAERKLQTLVDQTPNVMVMQELDQPRPAHVLVRGQYDQPGKPVPRGVPGILPPLPQDAPNNRLGFARWLVDPSHPLTARVAVNRQWQHFFGAGLVRTPEDFGTQGQRPTHPALLDWLATELVASSWDIKHIQRLIVTSATYGQSSRVEQKAAAQDPENRLLGRGPRLRLSAQALRDQALFASGLLVEQLGGPSVNPYQPPGLWEELANQTYEQGHGRDLYRRSLYTYWKRTAASPAMMTFDASDRETCTVRRSRTNTPLQALTLLNEVTFVEAARVLAERVLLSPGEDTARLTSMFELATARKPSERELKVLQQSLTYHRQNFSERSDEITRLMALGEAKSAPALNSAEVAAYTAIANLVLNLDEVITKE